MAAIKSEQARQIISVLPDVAFTKNNVPYAPRKNRWHFQDGTFQLRIDFDRIPAVCGALTDSLRWTLSTALKTNAAHYVQNLFNAFIHFASKLQAVGAKFATIGVREIQAFSAALLPHETYRLTTLNALLQRWFALGCPGVQEECVQYMRERRKKGNRKGNAVRTHDPVQGPFTETEFMLLYRAFDSAYGRGDLEPWAFALGRLLFATGGRITQFASMKLRDLEVTLEPDGSRAFFIHLPLVKLGEQHSRKRTKMFELSRQTGQLLHDYVSEAQAGGADPDAPFFPSDREKAGHGLFEGHCTGTELSSRFVRAAAPHAPVTERLDGAEMPLAPRRFRYTLGTRLAAERCSRAVIADRLGHSDLQNVDVYIEASPQLVENIDTALSEFLAPIAQAFRGRLVEDESKATLAGVPSSRIYDFRSTSQGVGSCGKTGGCGFDKPVACYTCFKFEPWLDAPHEKVLARLLAERQRQDADPRVAAVNDHTLLALREVIAECAAVRAQRGGTAHA